jgi:hypothetical protein
MTSKDWISTFMFRFLELVFVGALILTIVLAFTVTMPPANEKMLYMVIGALISINTQIGSYEWGSSRGSDRKTEIMAGSDAGEKKTTETTTTQTNNPLESPKE